MVKNQQKVKYNSYRNIPRIVLFSFLILCLTSIQLISAMDWDNSKKIQDTIGKAGYPNIEIGNFFGYGKVLWKGTLDENTKVCGTNCYAVQTIELLERGSLIDKVIFETINKDGSRTEQPIRNYQFYIQTGLSETEVDDYDYICSDEYNAKNDTHYKKCEFIKKGTHIEYSPIWEEYVLGSELEPGNYSMKLEGEKRYDRTVDWKIKSKGEWLDEWAIWYPTGDLYENILHYYKLDETAGTALFDIGGYDKGNQQDGTLITDASFSTEGLINGAVLNGTNGMVNISNVNDINESNFTLSFWVNITNDATNPAILSNQPPVGVQSFNLYHLHAIGALRMYVDTGAFVDTAAGVLTYGGKWHHIVLIGNATGTFLYVNGNYTQEKAGRWVNGTNFHFGSDYDYRADDTVSRGYIDEIGIWNASLSEENITSLNNSGLGWAYEFGSGVAIVSPADNYLYGEVADFNCTATSGVGATVLNMSLWTNVSGTWAISNSTIGLAVANQNELWEQNITTSGNYLWSCQACDSDEVCAFALENRTVKIDITSPTITINQPTGNISYGIKGGNQTINWSIVEPNVDTVWFEYRGVNTTSSGLTNQTNFTLGASPFNLTVWVNDTVGNKNSAKTYWEYYLFETNTSFSSEAYETTQETLELEIETRSGLSSISANLWYNGTAYSSTVTNPTGRVYNTTNILEIPLIEVDGTKLFFWSFDFLLPNGTGLNVNSSNKTQTVNRTWFTYCNAAYDVPFVNFSTFEAVNPFPIKNATFKITLDWYFNSSTGDVKRNLSWEDITETNSSWGFCASPSDRTRAYIVNAHIEYDNVGYAKNYYYLNDETYTNHTTNLSLYLLNDSDATLTVLRAEDGAQNPLGNIEIEIQLRDVGTGTDRTVAMAKTNFDGEDLAYLNWYDTLYKFILRQNGVIVKNTEPYKISETPQIFKILPSTTFDFDKFEDITYSLTYNETTKTFILVYTKPTAVDKVCLRVIKRSIYNDTQVCLTCNTAASATMICDLTPFGNGTYIAAFYGTGSPIKLIYALSAMVDLSNQIYDALGNVDATTIAIIFAGVVTVMFFVSPVMGIIGVLLGMFGAVALGFQPLEGNFYFAYAGIILMGGFIAWLIKK